MTTYTLFPLMAGYICTMLVDGVPMRTSGIALVMICDDDFSNVSEHWTSVDNTHAEKRGE